MLGGHLARRRQLRVCQSPQEWGRERGARGLFGAHSSQVGTRRPSWKLRVHRDTPLLPLPWSWGRRIGLMSRGLPRDCNSPRTPTPSLTPSASALPLPTPPGQLRVLHPARVHPARVHPARAPLQARLRSAAPIAGCILRAHRPSPPLPIHAPTIHQSSTPQAQLGFCTHEGSVLARSPHPGARTRPTSPRPPTHPGPRVERARWLSGH